MAAVDGVDGRIVAVADGVLTGWARDARKGEHRLRIGIAIDGAVVTEEVARLFRETLRLAGVGDGGHAFAIEFPERFRDGNRHSVAVVTLGAGFVLAADSGYPNQCGLNDSWKPTAFDVVDSFPESIAESGLKEGDGVYAGRVEGIADGVVYGWAIAWADLDGPVAVRIIVDEMVVAETIADVERKDLLAHGIGSAHGFEVDLPHALCDSRTHRLSVLMPDDSAVIGSSAFAVTALPDRAPDWTATGFHIAEARGQPRARRAQLVTGDRRWSGALGRPLQRPAALRLRPAAQAQLSRRARGREFGHGAYEETISLSDPLAVRRDSPFWVTVQPAVLDEEGERRQRASLAPEYLAPGAYASRVPDGIVDTNSFVICPDETRYYVDSVRFLPRLTRAGFSVVDGGVLEYEGGDSIQERDEKVVVLGGQNSQNYYHWLLESVARALLYKPLDDGTVQYLAPTLAGWQREMLGMAGVPPDRIIETPPVGLVRFREVISVSRGIAGIHEPLPAAIAALADLAEPATAAKRIFVTRRHANVRRISNEDELEDLISAYGFETIATESLSVPSQVQLFARASAVVGLHGAGLANIAFSRPGTQVIELCPAGAVWSGNAIYRTLAAIREQPFVQVVCRIDPDTAGRAQPQQDVIVDVDHLEGVFRQTYPAEPRFR